MNPQQINELSLQSKQQTRLPNDVNQSGNFVDSEFEPKRFDWATFIYEKYIENNRFKFIREQGELRSLNRLSGRIYNPVGLFSTLFSDSPNIDSSGIVNLLAQQFGGGILDTTDGKNFGVAVDNDSEKRFYSSKDFEVLSEAPTFGQSLLNQITSNIPIFPNSPDRSIMAQARSFENELRINGENKKGMGVNSLLLALGSDLPVRNLVYFLKIRNALKSGKMQQNISVINPVASERAQNRAIQTSKNILNRIFPNIGGVLDSIEPLGNSETLSRLNYNNGEEFKPEDIDFNKATDYSDFKMRTDSLGGNFLHYQSLRDSLLYEFLRNRYTVNTSHNPRGLLKTKEFDKNIDKQIKYKGTEKEPNGEFLYLSLRKLSSTSQTSLSEILNKIKELNYDFKDSLDYLDKRNLNDEVLIQDISTHFPENSQNKSHMIFEDVRTGRKCFLRASFDTFSDDSQMTMTPTQYVNRTEPLYNYENTTRSFTFPFTLYCSSPAEFLMMYKKLEFIKSLQYPLVVNGNVKRMQAPMHRITIGDYIRGVAGHLTSFGSSINNDQTVWETSIGKFAPKIIQCSMSMSVVHNTMPFSINGTNQWINERPHGVLIDA